MVLSLFGALDFGGGNLLPGGSFGGVRVMGSFPAYIEEEVSVSGESGEGEDDEEYYVIEEYLE